MKKLPKSAITGRIVKKSTARKNPRTTYFHTIRRKKR